MLLVGIWFGLAGGFSCSARHNLYHLPLSAVYTGNNTTVSAMLWCSLMS
ncbi:MAG TPA: hypothetical protein VIG67_07205 [Yaniella sp.]